jgi:hypothetical protein
MTRGGRGLRAVFDETGGMSRAATSGCVGELVTVVVLVMRGVEIRAVISVIIVWVEFCVGPLKVETIVE